jgi:DNA polymerase III delta prime subunit
MSAMMQILGWKADGLRCPDHEVDFRKSGDSPHGVSLIQMPNGTGKTTTLGLLRAALSGSAAKGGWDGTEMMKYRKLGSDQTNGSFEVRLMLGSERVTIIMNFDFEVSRVRYKTTRGEGQVDGFEPPYEFRRFMSAAFVEAFVFDGELAERLLDEKHLRAEEIVEDLFQIGTLKKLQDKITEYWDEVTKKSATEEVALTRRQNKLKRLREHLDRCRAQKEDLEGRRDETAARLQQQYAAYEQEISKEESRAQELEQRKDTAASLRRQVREEALDILDVMRSPNALSPIFARTLHDLKIGLDRVKLPESAAREFFTELAEEEFCVCGRLIDDHIRGEIRSRAEQYLGSNDVTLLNAMKTAIQDAVGQSHESAEEELRRKLHHLSMAMGEERSARNEVDLLQRAAEQADPAVRDASEEIRRLETRLADISDELDQHTNGDTSENTRDVNVLAVRVKDAEDDVAEITKTITLKRKRDILRKILREAYHTARRGILDEVRDEANQRIRELMPHNEIEILRIEKCLVLAGKEGGSVGENLSIAYAFLASLFNRSEHQLPFIVDSPANPIDLANRSRIGPLIPRLTRQFIAFTISSEREQFVPNLKQACDDGVQFITLFRKVDEQLIEAARVTPDHVETRDGIVVHGEPFFNEFQVQTEEAS